MKYGFCLIDFPDRLWQRLMYIMLQENKHTWSNVIYKCITTICAFRLANSVSIYPQHFACHRQIYWSTFIINCSQNNVIGHTDTSVLMNYFVLDPSCFVMTTKQGETNLTREQYKRIIIYLPSTVHTVTKINPRKILPRIDICKRKKSGFFLLFLSLRTIIIFYRQM